MASRRGSPIKEIIYRLVHMAFVVMRILADHAIYPLLNAIKGGRSQKLPIVNNNILLEGASDLAAKIREGELTSSQVVTAYIRRLREINPLLNAVTDERYRAALEDAKEADEKLQKCKDNPQALEDLRLTKPFFGVPITTKNALAVKDLGNEAGLYIRKGLKAPCDSHAVDLMRKSGAIPIAVTNTPELCLWLESYNTLFGTTANAYNTYRTSGGSSGGEGAILAGCGSAFGIGTDIAGSIRVPAFYNGIFGLKPTMNTVNIDGHYPMPQDILHPLLIAGPMCKYARDLRPFLNALVNRETALKMRLDSVPKLDSLKVHYFEDINSSIVVSVTSEIRKSVRDVAAYLASLSNSTSKEVSFSKMSYSTEIYFAYLTKAKCPSLAEELTMLKGKISAGRELVKYLIGRSKHSLPAIFVSLMEKLVQDDKESVITNRFYDMSKALEIEVEQLLGDDGIIVCPTLPDVAPYHGLTLLRPSILAYTGIWNILGFPAITIPLGLSPNGQPLGVTVVAGKYKDNVCCEIALELEKKFGGWVPPFDIKCKQ